MYIYFKKRMFLYKKQVARNRTHFCTRILVQKWYVLYTQHTYAFLYTYEVIDGDMFQFYVRMKLIYALYIYICGSVSLFFFNFNFKNLYHVVFLSAAQEPSAFIVDTRTNCVSFFIYLPCVCVCACVRACVRVCVCACVRVRVRVCSFYLSFSLSSLPSRG